MAVAHADYVLELQSNLDHDEMPPAWMWPYQKRMNEHIKDVQKQRRERMNAPAKAEDEGMVENELMKGMRR